jgi:hypothetical protein
MRVAQLRAMGIKTPEGQRMYMRALAESGRIQEEREKYKVGSKKWERLTEKDVRVVNEALEKARALTPPSKPAKKKKPVSVRLKRWRT